MNNLTKRQSEYIDKINEFISKNFRKPTVREICNFMERNSPATVQAMLNLLQRKGYTFTTKEYFSKQIEEINRLTFQNNKLKNLFKEALKIINEGDK